MTILMACVPSLRFCVRLNQTFRSFGIRAHAASGEKLQRVRPLLREHLPCPIEPDSKLPLAIHLEEGLDVDQFIHATFRDTAFMSALMVRMTSDEDIFSIECLVAACFTRNVIKAYDGASSTRRLHRAVKQEGLNKQLCQIAERLLSIPSLLNLLSEFAEDLIAGRRSGLTPH